MILVDANLVLRATQRQHSSNPVGKKAIAKLRLEGETLCLVLQVIYEFWVVATRPTEQNGLGWSAAAAEADLYRLRQDFRLFRDERSMFEHWYDLVTTYKVLGKPAHDARLVAAMHRHRIPKILTFNVADFIRYPNVEVLDAAQIGAESS